ncbi:hypothetical protein A2Z33_05905 [Candidatus Gottesmanbacteria bacterium RBG_16_52_11]|uniref:Uncharacterized protein n=1 Tax=Candidatus Gottesmanbacteria bacterium RBG_16_52_11 TaxID=1798374 RepID=A0A1F5YXG3_9BACT|nr:MAG: hypothetical protein A2Z33_05905 [Candidatus Gottesmanbacteria bacterium RBG_16_52_11]
MDPRIDYFDEYELTEVWNNERDFTEWLAKKENIEKFISVFDIEVDISTITTFLPVDKLQADIVLKDKSGDTIIIELQLGSADDEHLGKLLAYAANKEANYIIWVFENISDEYRETLHWLNRRTNSSTEFYGVRVVLEQSKKSENTETTRSIRYEFECDPIDEDSESSDELTNLEQYYDNFWEAFQKYVREKYPSEFGSLKPQKPDKNYSIPINFKGGTLAAYIDIKSKEISGQFINRDKNWFRQRMTNFETDIKSKFGVLVPGQILDFDTKRGRKVSKVIAKKKFEIDHEDLTISDATYEPIFKWLASVLIAMKQIIKEQRDIKLNGKVDETDLQSEAHSQPVSVESPSETPPQVTAGTAPPVVVTSTSVVQVPVAQPVSASASPQIQDTPPPAATE